MKRESIEINLANSVLFTELSPQEVATCADHLEVRYISEGEYVYRQNTQTDYFHVIAVGEVELILEFEDGSAGVVGRIGPGGHFGETAILTDKGHATSCRALFDLVLISFSKENFYKVLFGNEKIRRKIEFSLAERLRISFSDQGDMSRKQGGSEDIDSAGRMVLFKGRVTDEEVSLRHQERSQAPIQNLSVTSRAAKKIQAKIAAISENDEPFFIYGEEGTGRSIISKQIHLQSNRDEGPYHNFDLREYHNIPKVLEKKLFGVGQDSFPFFKTRRAGYLEQTCGGTLVFEHVELLTEVLQQKLVRLLRSSVYTHLDSEQQIALQSRIVFVSSLSLSQLQKSGKIIPELFAIFEKQNFTIPALREHKQDLPRLVDHYLHRFSGEYGKQVDTVTPATLGVLMNYDWPGNLTELSTVIRRAVMLAPGTEVRSEQILLGLPKSEGKWEFNLLRLPLVRKFLKSKTFPGVPQKIVGGVLLLAIFSLFFGSSDPAENVGLTISWSIGWPLMFFSFFFLARIWCSVCTLAVPGQVLQNILKPKRKAPRFLKQYSGWMMAFFCIIIFWIEIVWDAYKSPILSGSIILTITVGSIIFSAIYTRRAWCRYLCPLGAVSAIFAMPSIIELRSNRHVCLNKCQEHACFGGSGGELTGCPMFRHPYLVDNNRDCIFCGDCIKSCNNRSIQLNLRLAPQELWTLQAPRFADSFLIVALGGIFFPFAMHSDYSGMIHGMLAYSEQKTGLVMPYGVVASIIFFAIVYVAFLIYSIFVYIQSDYCDWDYKELFALFGYGLIPLILGSYLAVHFRIFIEGAGTVIPKVQNALGGNASLEGWSIMSPDSAFVLQVLAILGGFFASAYATYRISLRLSNDNEFSSKTLVLPLSFLMGLTVAFLYML